MQTKQIAAALVCALAATTTVAQSTDPLPSWNDGKTKQSILTFVSKVTKEGSPQFVPPAERIATFDNDGTLWAEQPWYFQLHFAIDRIKDACSTASGVEGKGALQVGTPMLIRQATLDFFDDNVFKPVAIQRNIGRRPIAAFGNSDGDLQMLQWTCAGAGTRFCLFVRHTDAEQSSI